MTRPLSSPRAVTRADVAARAGVSAAVVSYVVNEGPRQVAPATKEKVLAAIAALGYRPNAAARALRLGSSELLGLLVPDNRNPFDNELAHAVEEEAERHGYSLLMANSGRSLQRQQRQLQHLISRQVEGVIVVPMSGDLDATELRAAGIPLTFLADSRADPAVPSACTDLFAGAVLAVEHLLGHGHESVALLIGRTSGPNVDGRERGWRATLEEAGHAPGPLLRAEFSREGGYAAGLEFLALPERPTAIFTSSDMQAIGLLRALHEAGVSVPGQVAVVSFDGSPESEYAWPTLTTVKQPIAAMARAAVESVLDLLRNPAQGPRHQQFPAELALGRSCGCP